MPSILRTVVSSLLLKLIFCWFRMFSKAISTSSGLASFRDCKNTSGSTCWSVSVTSGVVGDCEATLKFCSSSERAMLSCPSSIFRCSRTATSASRSSSFSGRVDSSSSLDISWAISLLLLAFFVLSSVSSVTVSDTSEGSNGAGSGAGEAAPPLIRVIISSRTCAAASGLPVPSSSEETCSAKSFIIRIRCSS